MHSFSLDQYLVYMSGKEAEADIIITVLVVCLRIMYIWNCIIPSFLVNVLKQSVFSSFIWCTVTDGMNMHAGLLLNYYRAASLLGVMLLMDEAWVVWIETFLNCSEKTSLPSLYNISFKTPTYYNGTLRDTKYNRKKRRKTNYDAYFFQIAYPLCNR